MDSAVILKLKEVCNYPNCSLNEICDKLRIRYGIHIALLPACPDNSDIFIGYTLISTKLKNYKVGREHRDFISSTSPSYYPALLKAIEIVVKRWL